MLAGTSLKLPKNITDALYKLPDNIIKETQQIAGKTYLILKSNNSIKLAKISEDAVFSELKLMQEGAVVKLMLSRN